MQTNLTKTVKPNNDSGLQARTTEHQLATAVLRNGGFSGKSKCSFSNQHLWWVDKEFASALDMGSYDANKKAITSLFNAAYSSS